MLLRYIWKISFGLKNLHICRALATLALLPCLSIPYSKIDIFGEEYQCHVADHVLTQRYVLTYRAHGQVENILSTFLACDFAN